MKSTKIDMTEGPIFGKLIRYSVPIVLTGLLQLLFNAADLIVVGRFCGSDCVGAVGATASLVNLLISFSMGISAGGGVVVAQKAGAKDDEGIFRATHSTMVLALVCGLLLTFVGCFFSRTFLEWMDTPADIIDLSTTYMRIYFLGMTANMVYNFGAAVLRAVGDTKKPLYFLLLSGIINVVLNVFLVVVCKMDVDGVAIATTVSQLISAVCVVVILAKREDACRLYISKLRFYKEEVVKIIKIGLPAGIQSSLFHISNVIIQSSINSFGTAAVSGNAAASNLNNFSNMVMNGFVQGALNFVGQNTGAKKYDRIGKVVMCCLVCVFITTLMVDLPMYIFNKPLLSIYLKDDMEAIELGRLRMIYVGLLHCIAGIMDVMTSSIRGMGKSTVPMVITVMGVCGFRLVWIFTVFAKIRTLDVLYMSYPITWAITFIAEVIAFVIIRNNMVKREREALHE